MVKMNVLPEDPGLSRGDLDANALRQFRRWLHAAEEAHLPEPMAMTLATVSPDGRPAARMVLLKRCDEYGFVFSTYYTSPKGQDMAANPCAALVFYWAALHRQVRISGRVAPVSAAESDDAFRVRPRGHQLTVLASSQSEPVPDRAALETQLAAVESRYAGLEAPRPPHWGSYRVTPETIEFWQGRVNRLHDRFLYTWRANDSWQIVRLAP